MNSIFQELNSSLSDGFAKVEAKIEEQEQNAGNKNKVAITKFGVRITV